MQQALLTRYGPGKQMDDSLHNAGARSRPLMSKRVIFQRVESFFFHFWARARDVSPIFQRVRFRINHVGDKSPGRILEIGTASPGRFTRNTDLLLEMT